MAKSNSERQLKIAWVRHLVQLICLFIFIWPLISTAWGLFGVTLGTGDGNTYNTPASLPFYGSLSSSTIFGIITLDPFATIEVTAATKSLSDICLIGIIPVLLVYGLIRGRAFCAWVCPVNLLLEITDVVRDKLGIKISENPIPRHTKIYIAIIVVALSALLSFPVFEAISPLSAINKGILFGSLTGTLLLIAIVIANLFWAKHTWCRSLCPLGGFWELIGKVGLVNVKLKHDACIQCSACKHACLADPAILDDALAKNTSVVGAGDCMACGACVDACPTHALSLYVGKGELKENA